MQKSGLFGPCFECHRIIFETSCPYHWDADKYPDSTSLEEVVRTLVSASPWGATDASSEAINNPYSLISQLRSRVVVTASQAAVMWNCGYTSRMAFVKDKTGMKKLPPPNEVARGFMQAGINAEPMIWAYWKTALRACVEQHRIRLDPNLTRTVTPLLHFTRTGAFARANSCDSVDNWASASPDGLLVYGDDMQTARMVPVEIKYYASKTQFADEIPVQYVAQIAMQMWVLGSNIGVYFGRVDCEGESFYEWKIFKAKLLSWAELEQRLEYLADDIANRNTPRCMREEAALRALLQVKHEGVRIRDFYECLKKGALDDGVKLIQPKQV